MSTTYTGNFSDNSKVNGTIQVTVPRNNQIINGDIITINANLTTISPSILIQRIEIYCTENTSAARQLVYFSSRMSVPSQRTCNTRYTSTVSIPNTIFSNAVSLSGRMHATVYFNSGYGVGANLVPSTIIVLPTSTVAINAPFERFDKKSNVTSSAGDSVICKKIIPTYAGLSADDISSVILRYKLQSATGWTNVSLSSTIY